MSKAPTSWGVGMKTLRRAENVLSSTEQSRLEQHTALYAIVWDLAAKTSGNNPLERERISKTRGKIQTIEESKWDKRKTVEKGPVFFFFFPCLTWLWWLVVNEFLMMFLKSLSYLLGLTQCLLLLGLCTGENRGGRWEIV